MVLDNKFLNVVEENLNKLEEGTLKYFITSFSNEKDRNDFSDKLSDSYESKIAVSVGEDKNCETPFSLVVYMKGLDLSNYFGKTSRIGMVIQNA